MLSFKSNRLVSVPDAALPRQLEWLILTDNAVHLLRKSVAISEGLDVPAMTLPQFEDVKPLEGALALSREKVKGLNETLDSILTHIRSIETRISNRKLGEFMTQLKAMAAAQGVKLAQVRDKLIESEGAALASLMDGDELARLRHEVSTLRPENAQLKADKATLQNGITKLTEQRRYA
jgi:predicted  nucleic acid-binding Zn-ribbon protein